MRKRLDDNGHEVLDPTPVAIPSGFKRPETLAEQVQRLVRTHISRLAEQEGHESFDEAEDFDVGDDADPSTPYETFFDPVLGKEFTPAEFKQHEELMRRRYLEAQESYFRELDRQEVIRRAPSRDHSGVGGNAGRPPRSERPTAEPADQPPEK